MKIGELIRVKGVFTPLFKEKLSPKLSYKLMKFISKIEVEEAFYNKKINDLADKYCERDDDKNFVRTETGIKIREDKQKECNEELREIENVDVEVPDITFTLDELSEVKLSAQDMLFLQEFIVE